LVKSNGCHLFASLISSETAQVTSSALGNEKIEELSDEEMKEIAGGRFVYWTNAGGYRIGAWVY
jgi:natural product precursor